MNLDFANYTITIAIVPVDLRAGYSRLSAIALTLMKIDVDQGNDVVIFISKRRHMCKVLWSDQRGHSLLTRRLNQGTFQKLVARAEDPNGIPFTKAEVLHYLDGGSVQAIRKRFLINC